MVKQGGNYLVIFGFLSKKQMLEFIKEKNGQYDVMKLINVGEDYLNLITSYNCPYWLLSKLGDFSTYVVELGNIDLLEAESNND